MKFGVFLSLRNPLGQGNVWNLVLPFISSPVEEEVAMDKCCHRLRRRGLIAMPAEAKLGENHKINIYGICLNFIQPVDPTLFSTFLIGYSCPSTQTLFYL